MSADPHYIECARAAYAILIERASTHQERRELKQELADIERDPDPKMRRAQNIHMETEGRADG